MYKSVLLVQVAAVLLTSISARAAVVESTPNGFAVEESAHIGASSAKVYAALIEPARWWNPEHTFSSNASNLSLHAKAGGCLCEALPGGGSVQHLTVLVVEPEHTLRLLGAMGPLQGQALTSVLTFTLAAKDGATELKLENNIGGFMKGGFGKWPAAVDAMLADLVAHLKAYCESSKR